MDIKKDKKVIIKEVKNHNNTGYTLGCRCDKCKQARTEYTRKYRSYQRVGIK